MTHRIKFIVCYYGDWPPWFDAFLLSAARNQNIDWLFFTDCKLPLAYPKNVQFINMPLGHLYKLVQTKIIQTDNYFSKDNRRKFEPTTSEVEIDFYKICDFRPTYGILFKEELQGYDFWGQCDIDQIFGDINFYITNNMLKNYDIISSRKGKISGHFTLFKNIPKVNNLFKKIDNYNQILLSKDYHSFDEYILSNYLLRNQHNLNIKWDKCLLNFPQETFRQYPDKEIHPGRLSKNEGLYTWKSGKLFYNHKEIMYLHFMYWKDTLKTMNFKFSDDVPTFNIKFDNIYNT